MLAISLRGYTGRYAYLQLSVTQRIKSQCLSELSDLTWAYYLLFYISKPLNNFCFGPKLIGSVKSAQQAEYGLHLCDFTTLMTTLEHNSLLLMIWQLETSAIRSSLPFETSFGVWDSHLLCLGPYIHTLTKLILACYWSPVQTGIPM